MKRDIDEIRETIYDALDRHLYDRASSAIDALLPLARVEALGLRVSLFIEADDVSSAEAALAALMAARQDMTADETQYATFLSARVHFMRGERMSVIRELEPLMSARGGHVKGELREKIANLLGQCYRFIGESEKATAMYLEAAKAARANGDVALAAVEMSDYLFNRHYLPVKWTSAKRRRVMGSCSKTARCIFRAGERRASIAGKSASATFRPTFAIMSSCGFRSPFLNFMTAIASRSLST